MDDVAAEIQREKVRAERARAPRALDVAKGELDLGYPPSFVAHRYERYDRTITLERCEAYVSAKKAQADAKAARSAGRAGDL